MCFFFFFFKSVGRKNLSIYLSVVHSFCLAGGWPLTFSCYSTDLCQFVTEIISLTSVYFKEKVWWVVTFWERLQLVEERA